MVIKEEFHFLFIIGIAAFVASNVCPPTENIPHCKCESNRNTLNLTCSGSRTGKTIQDYGKILQDNHFEYKRNIKLHFDGFTEDSRLPSRVFEGFDIVELRFEDSKNISRWADEEEGPAFVGLEDNLKELSFVSVIYIPWKKGIHLQENAPMSLGHLSKLRRVKFYSNDIYAFANGWFKEGPSSLQVLDMKYCGTRSIGNRAFASLPNLRHILINSSALERLSRTMFPNPANNLKEIDLWGNRLEDLPIDMFTNMPSLIKVDLSNNQIMRIPEIVWRPVWSRLNVLTLTSIVTGSSLICDGQIDWIFNVRPPLRLHALCEEPEHMKGKELSDLIREKQSKK